MKFKMFFWISVVINILFGVVFVLYQFTPYLDWKISSKVVPRLCESSPQSEFCQRVK